MKPANMRIILILVTSCLISACGVGQKKILFTTLTNVGLDVDAKQLTAQVNINRQEAVIGPTFEGGQHVAVVAGFRNNNRLLGSFGVSSVFAGGEAAVKLTCDSKTECDKSPELIELSEAPVFHKGFIHRGFDMINPFTSSKDDSDEESLPGPGQVKPFVFNTDTSLGIKLAWTGESGPYPDKVQIGFKREEFAFAPIMQSAHLLAFNPSKDIDNKKKSIKFRQKLNDGTPIIYHQVNNKPIVGLNDGVTYWVKLVPADTSKTTFQLAASQAEWAARSFIPLDATGVTGTGYHFDTVKVTIGIPSFFAAIDTNSDFHALADSKIGSIQAFAVGDAATNLAADPKIKAKIYDKFGLGNNGLCLSKWLYKAPSNTGTLTGWLANPTITPIPKILPVTIEDLINDSSLWTSFVTNNNIVCGS